MLAVCCFATGTLSLAREVKSDYQMFSRSDVQLAAWVEENTEKDDTFICWTQHINPVSALAGRDIVCGPGLWLYYHGYDLSARENDIRTFYQDPANNRHILEKYSVDYILLGGYEYNDARANGAALADNYECVYEAPDGTRIFSAGDKTDD